MKSAPAASGAAAPRTTRTSWLLNALATIQLVWFYLARVPSALNIQAFEQGRERTPFQQRMLLMLPLRYVHQSHLFEQAAAFLNLAHGWFGLYSGHIRPESVFELLLDLFCVLVTGLIARRIYMAASRTGLLTPFVYPLTLLMMLITYTIQANHPLRFLYDLPAMAFFSVGIYLLYFRRSPLLFACLFIVATINRETTLLLLPAYWLGECVPRDASAPARGWRALLRPETIAVSLVLLGWWVGWHLWVVRHFAANASASGPRLLLNLCTVLVPLSCRNYSASPAYAWPLTFLYRRLLRDRVLRAWIWLPVLWLASCLAMGLLIETRIFGELIASSPAPLP